LAGISFNSSVSSQAVNRWFRQSTNALEQNFARLSSGLRINKASDDSVGLAIAAGFDVDRRVNAQGLRNINDGISLLSIADSALDSMTAIGSRITELAESAANGTLGRAQRRALDEEAQALSKEYNRIIQSTSFNGSKLFNGSFAPLQVAIGYGNNGVIASSLGGAAGTGTFDARSSFTSGTDPYYLATADLNRDGVKDIISADSGAASVSVLLGNGDASYQARRSFSTLGSNPTVVVAADFTGDGVADLASGTDSFAWMTIYKGNGDGTFLASTSFAFAANFKPVALAVGDFNGDSRSDLAAVDVSGTKTISVLFGNGDGSFSLSATYTVAGSDPRGLAVADYNGDGIDDLAVTEPGPNKVGIWLGRSDGTFTSGGTYAIGTYPRAVSAADLNQDGQIDLVTADGDDGKMSVLFGNGNGTFRARTSYAAGTNTRWVQLGDFNSDGAADIVATDTGGNAISLLLNNGDGSFASRRTFAVGQTPYAVTVADMNNDGVPDVLTPDQTDGKVSVLLTHTVSGAAPLMPFSLRSRADALSALDEMKAGLQRLTLQRGVIAAFQSRLATAANISATNEVELAAATAQIRDADIAQEAAGLVRNQILQQAGVAILAQVNMEPRIALQLLSSAD
jgi:flagellin-like hook-associated protein FlgL